MKTLLKITILFIFISACTSPVKEYDSQGLLFNLFAKTPISLFDYTTEGISMDEKNELLEKGESEYWKISHKSDEKIVVSCKFPSSEVTLFLLKRQNNSPILVSYTENEQASSIVFWQVNNDDIMEEVNILPVIYAKDFFSNEHQFDKISKYNGNVYYFMDTETLIIKAAINTWMEEEFENRDIDYEISLEWNGTDFRVKKTSNKNKENADSMVSFDPASCNFPNELIIHPPKEPNSFPLMHDTRLFPVGISEKGVFAYFNFNGEMDPCECVHADLHFFSIKEDTIINTIPFRFDGEEYEKFLNPEKVWEKEKDKFCSALEEANISTIDYNIFEDEEFMRTIQLRSTPVDEEENDGSLWNVINYKVFNDAGEVVAESEKYAQIISAELVAQLRYQIGDNYFFVTVITTSHPGFEGSIRRQYNIFNHLAETNEPAKEDVTDSDNSDLINELYIDNNHDTIANPFELVETHQLDLNSDGKVDNIKLYTIQNWEDPGSFQKIEIKVTGRKTLTKYNYDGWTTFNDNYTITEEIASLNLIDSKNLLVLQATENKKLLLLFGYAYASDPGLLTIIEPQKSRIIFNKNWALSAILDRNSDSNYELQGTTHYEGTTEYLDLGTDKLEMKNE